VVTKHTPTLPDQLAVTRSVHPQPIRIYT